MSRRQRFLNPAHLGCQVALDSRFLTGLANNNPVSSWTGRAGTSVSPSATGTQRPTYIANMYNGQPGVRFSAASLQRLSATTSHSNPCTIFALNYPTADTVGFRIVLTLGVNIVGLGYGNTANVVLSSVSSNISTSRSRPTTQELYRGIINGASSSLAVNGVNVVTGTLNAFSTSSLVLAWNNSGGAFWDNDFCALAITNTAVSDPICKRIEQSIATSFKHPL